MGDFIFVGLNKNGIKSADYVYKSQKMWYNNSAKQTKYTVYGCIFFLKDTYALFRLYSLSLWIW